MFLVEQPNMDLSKQLRPAKNGKNKINEEQMKYNKPGMEAKKGTKEWLEATQNDGLIIGNINYITSCKWSRSVCPFMMVPQQLPSPWLPYQQPVSRKLPRRDPISGKVTVQSCDDRVPRNGIAQNIWWHRYNYICMYYTTIHSSK